MVLFIYIFVAKITAVRLIRNFFIELHEIDYIGLKFDQHVWYNFLVIDYKISALELYPLIDLSFSFFCKIFVDFYIGGLLPSDGNDQELLFGDLFLPAFIHPLLKAPFIRQLRKKSLAFNGLLNNIVIFFFLNLLDRIKMVLRFILIGFILCVVDMRKRFSLIDENIVVKQMSWKQMLYFQIYFLILVFFICL